ncbi:hypothetical protein HZH68_009443 [Vespula germanica]|uniref:Uncharacterized protein n=1 Tax=Vespula germanica TaxID=30212 RepID=A0A834JVF1_VESGE|nr:hypothetical protein HZH68_009443 [Vespula germanica]
MPVAPAAAIAMAVAIAATQQQNSDGGSLSRDLTSSEPSIPLCLAQFALTQSPPRKLHLLSVQLPLTRTAFGGGAIYAGTLESTFAVSLRSNTIATTTDIVDDTGTGTSTGTSTSASAVTGTGTNGDAGTGAGASADAAAGAGTKSYCLLGKKKEEALFRESRDIRPRQQSRAEQSRAEQSRAEQSRAEQSRAEQSRAEQNRTEQSRAEQNRTEQSRVEQSRAEQSGAEQSRAEQSRVEQSRTEQNSGGSSSNSTASTQNEKPWLRPSSTSTSTVASCVSRAGARGRSEGTRAPSERRRN